MSSNEEELNDESQHSKKRRVQRACDICRRKKIRCDGGQMPKNKCSNCIAYNYSCTYLEAAKKRGPSNGYVQRLESRLEKMESLLNKLCPDEQTLKDLDESGELWPQRFPSSPSDISAQPPPLLPQHDLATTVIRRVNAPNLDATNDLGNSQTENDDEFAHIELANALCKLNVVDKHENRFFGKSSGAMFVRKAFEVRNAYEGVKREFPDSFFSSFRQQFWSIAPWEQAAYTSPKASFTFPSPDLLKSLTDLYFNNVNYIIPLIHRPSFQLSLDAGLHFTDDGFGATVLLVCAVGARYSDDERVKLDGVDSWASCGWQWYRQALSQRRAFVRPTLYDLQFYCLAVMFLQGASAPQSCWTMVGIGIRLALDVGAHRRKKSGQPMTMEDEMIKRAFWVLVCMDRLISVGLGRPCAIQDEDFDADYPVECDDEYWFIPPDTGSGYEPKPFSEDYKEQPVVFKQPKDKPSLVTAFVLFLKLNQVLSVLLRTIYSLKKNKIILGFVGPQWEQHIVTELDSAMNQWIDSVPDHLRWDPARVGDKFFNQSAFLYCIYYYVQILIHRPFIPSLTQPSSTTFPSLAICTNAARSCCHIIDLQRKMSLEQAPQQQMAYVLPLAVQMAVFSAGIVLLLNIWGGKRSGITTDPSKEMADVHKCMHALRACESRWNSAGRLWDILCELASAGNLPLPTTPPPNNNKRERDSDSPVSHPSSFGSPDISSTAPSSNVSSPEYQHHHLSTHDHNHHHPPPAVATGARAMAGSKRVHRQQQHHHLPSSQLNQEMVVQLPFYSNELGRYHPSSSSSSISSAFAVPDSIALSLSSSPAGAGMASQFTDMNLATPAASASAAFRHLQRRSQSSFSYGGPAAGMPPPFEQHQQAVLHQNNNNIFAPPPPLSASSSNSNFGGGPGAGAVAFQGGVPPPSIIQHSSSAGSASENHLGFLGDLNHLNLFVPGAAAGAAGATNVNSNNNSSNGSGLEPSSPTTGFSTTALDAQTLALMNNDIFAMWSNAPAGLELDDWGAYLTNVNEMAQGYRFNHS